MSISALGSAASSLQWPSFQTTDTDNDDALSLQEITAAGQNLPPGGINGLDSDSLQTLFSAIDTDGDGKISKTEAKTASDKLSTAMQGALLGAQEHAGQPPSPSEMFAKADVDGSGGLSFDEFKAAAPNAANAGDDKLKALFGSLDKNSDGTISQDEMKAARPHGHHRHPPPPESTQSADSTNLTADGETSVLTQAANGAGSLLLQAADAYGSAAGFSAADLVNELAGILKAA
jgi:Ca2+-binding EF-hand superfamily protein